jgi:uncharacterized membrane protein YidH (DUF202 family)
MPDPQLAHADDGLQPERTLLAWRRTILALVVCCCMYLRWVPHHHWFAALPAALCLLLAGATWLRLRRRYHHLVRGLHDEGVVSGVTEHLLLALGVTMLCAIELAAIVLYPA